MRRRFFRLVVPVLLVALAGPAAAGQAEDYLAQADLAWSRDDLAGAEQLFLAAVESAVDGQPALRLGGFYLGQNRLEEAVERFRQAISAGLPEEPMQARAFAGMGLAYLHLQDPALAAAALEEAVRLDPSREPELRPVLEQLRTGNP